MSLAVSLNDVKKAAEVLRDIAKHTPLLRAERMDEALGFEVYLKPENLQLTGSFKIRGASNKIANLTEEEKARGIIASSSGNHAQGVAYAANLAQVSATVVMPENAPQTKVDGTARYGAKVILHGFDSIERYKELYRLVDVHGYTVVHSFNDPHLIAGQGTVGLEIMEDLADADAVVVPLGGGGILSGVAVAVKETNPDCLVIGVEPEAIPRFSASLAAGGPVEVPFKDTVADGLMLTKTGTYTWPIIRDYVDHVVTVSDASILEAMKLIMTEGRQVVEPSAAIGVAAALEGKIPAAENQKVVFVLTGGNIDYSKLKDLMI